MNTWDFTDFQTFYNFYTYVRMEMKQKVPYQELVQGATDVMLIAGYYSTSVAKVMMTAHLGKGSFQNYFHSKKAMGHAVIEHYTNQLLSWQQEAFSQKQLSPWQRIHLYYSALCDHFENKTYFKGGCMVGNLGLELADVSISFNKQLNEFVNSFNQNLSLLIAEGQNQNNIHSQWSPQEMAELILMTWEGSVWRMKLTVDRVPLDLFLDKFLPSLKLNQQK